MLKIIEITTCNQCKYFEKSHCLAYNRTVETEKIPKWCYLLNSDKISKIMKISFDFDGVLTTEKMQQHAQKYIAQGHDVYITTSRRTEEFFNENNVEINIKKGELNKDVFEIAEKIGIPKDHIRFTNFKDKYPILEDFDIHYDDDPLEIRFIDDYLVNCVGVLFQE